MNINLIIDQYKKIMKTMKSILYLLLFYLSDQIIKNVLIIKSIKSINQYLIFYLYKLNIDN
jgi:hypothetical protein